MNNIQLNQTSHDLATLFLDILRHIYPRR